MELSVSTPMAFDAAATTDVASWAEAGAAARISNRVAAVRVRSRIAFLQVRDMSGPIYFTPTIRAAFFQ